MITDMESADEIEMGTIDGRIYHALEELSSVHPAGAADFGIGQCAFLVHESPLKSRVTFLPEA